MSSSQSQNSLQLEGSGKNIPSVAALQTGPGGLVVGGAGVEFAVVG